MGRNKNQMNVIALGITDEAFRHPPKNHFDLECRILLAVTRRYLVKVILG